jgi:hypothetical protein
MSLLSHLDDPSSPTLPTTSTLSKFEIFGKVSDVMFFRNPAASVSPTLPVLPVLRAYPILLNLVHHPLLHQEGESREAWGDQGATWDSKAELRRGDCSGSEMVKCVFWRMFGG